MEKLQTDAIGNYKLHQQLFESLPFGLITLNHAGHMVSINRSGAGMLGESLEYLYNLEFKLFLHADSFEQYQENRILAVDRNEVQSCEILLRGKQGSTIYTLCHFIPVYPNGSAAQVILCLQDTSQIKALESQLGTLRGPDRKVLHELNSVFTRIAGYADLTQLNLDERAGEDLTVLNRYMGEIRDGLQRAENLLQQNRKQRSTIPQTKQAEVNADQVRKRILIIDDEEPIVKFLEELMLQQGYQVDCFTRSKAALDYYRENVVNIDLVILDQSMPEMDGLELATEMKSLRLDQPIILCTGTNSFIEDQQKGEIHIRYFVSKPIDINELLTLVSEILQDDSQQQNL